MIPIDPILQRLRYRVQSGLPLLFPGAQCRIGQDNAVAITIDDGPSASTDGLLDSLQGNSIIATFFLSGEAVLTYPEQARAIVARGHTLGSHGFAHVDMVRFARDHVESDLEQSLRAIEDCTGVRPKFYRPPYGRLHPVHRDLPAAHGCALVLWNALPGDFDQQATVDELRRRIEKIREGDIVVLHDHAHALDRTTACISFIGDLLRRTGIRAVPLS